ncbi:hypothetical protein P9112_002030 [Eukaryota sp. TZLM1-RC]
MDLASKCNMTVHDNVTVENLSVNGIRSTTLGCARGVFAQNVSSLANQVFIRIEFQIIPGTNNLLIGRDLLQTLALCMEYGFIIDLDREHCIILNAEYEKLRLTGDLSGIGGVNDLTKPVEANMARISDILEFLSEANYIATLDLPKAFWQLKITKEGIDKTSLSIPGMSVSFKRACVGLKNVSPVFQNMEIFDSRGVLLFISMIL